MVGCWKTSWLSGIGRILLEEKDEKSGGRSKERGGAREKRKGERSDGLNLQVSSLRGMNSIIHG